MTPTELANQQLLTAWISAGAAATQAAGALGAIGASVWLARSSQKREDAAREASAQRERDADAAAERRAREADEAAERRNARAIEAQRAAGADALKAAHEDLVERTLGLARKAADLLSVNIAEWDAKAAKNDQTNWGGGSFGTTELIDIRRALEALAGEALADPELVLAISHFLRVSDPRSAAGVTGTAAVQAAALRKHEARWTAAIGAIKMRKRPEA